jgi:positive regulator of sigma E activity
MSKPAFALPAYQRRAERWDCDAEITIEDDCGRQLMARLGNISDSGFMAECEEKIRLGAIVTVTLPGRGSVNAEVRWALGWRFGAMVLES